jgi:metallo-beta-lactamase family protein
VVLTHAHIDHSGYLPKLVREGFRGRVFCTEATADLCELMLLDSAKIQESDAEFANRHGFSKHRPALPLYGKRDALKALEHFQALDFDVPTDLGHGANLTFRPRRAYPRRRQRPAALGREVDRVFRRSRTLQ